MECTGVSSSELVISPSLQTEAVLIGTDALSLASVNTSLCASMYSVSDSGTEVNELMLNFEEVFEFEDFIVLFLVNESWFGELAAMLDGTEELFRFSV